MNPGMREDSAARPFVGPSGRILRETYIRASGLAMVSHVYLGNSVRCWTPLTDQPTRKQHRTCQWAHLGTDVFHLHRLTAHAISPHTKWFDPMHELSSKEFPEAMTSLATRRKTHLVCLGAESLAALTSLFPITKPGAPPIPYHDFLSRKHPSLSLTECFQRHGDLELHIPVTQPIFSTQSALAEGSSPDKIYGAVRVRLWATYHPAALLRDGAKIHAVASHLSLLKTHLDGRPPLPSHVFSHVPWNPEDTCPAVPAESTQP